MTPRPAVRELAGAVRRAQRREAERRGPGRYGGVVLDADPLRVGVIGLDEDLDEDDIAIGDALAAFLESRPLEPDDVLVLVEVDGDLVAIDVQSDRAVPPREEPRLDALVADLAALAAQLAALGAELEAELADLAAQIGDLAGQLAALAAALADLVAQVEALPASGGGSPITIWKPTNADLWNAGAYGWFLPDDATDLVFVAQDNLVTVSGSVAWSGASSGYAPSHLDILRSGRLPAEFRPVGSHSHTMSSEDPDRAWIFKLFTNGAMQLGSIHAAPPGDVFGGVGASGTDAFGGITFVFEDWTYPITHVAAAGAGGGSSALEDVRPYTYGTGWSDYDEAAGFYQDPFGLMHLRGNLYYGGGGDPSHVVDFPVPFQPETVNVFGTVIAQDQGDGTTRALIFFIGAAGHMYLAPHSAWPGPPTFGYPPVDTVLYMGSIAPFRIDQ